MSSKLDDIILGTWADGTFTGSPDKQHTPIAPEEAKAQIKALFNELVDNSTEQQLRGNFKLEYINATDLRKRIESL